MVLMETFFILCRIWPAGLLMLGLGTGFAIVLLIASIKLKVEVDPKIVQVHEVLPNIDCGACGFAGCASYAKAVVNNPQLLGKCAPGGPSVSNKIAGILNLQMSGGGKPLSTSCLRVSGRKYSRRCPPFLHGASAGPGPARSRPRKK